MEGFAVSTNNDKRQSIEEAQKNIIESAKKLPTQKIVTKEELINFLEED